MGCGTSRQEVIAPRTDEKRRDEQSSSPVKMKTSVQVRLEQKSDGIEMPLGPENFVNERKAHISDLYDFLSPPLGTGAFGEVRKAQYKANGEVRAVKILAKAAQTPEDRERLINEVNVLKQLDHPNIIKILEYYQDERSFYIVMELCTGGELFDRIVDAGHLTESRAINIMSQTLSAIAYCHRHKIVHRDLKPENLLLETKKDDAPIKVIDFGMSRVFDPNNKMKHKLGTIYYMAPEVIKALYDERCDVWACGVIAFILLCGYPPFNGRTDDDIKKKIEIGKYDFSGRNWLSVSEAAKKFISRMLVYEPSKRATAAELLNDPWLAQKGAGGAASSPLEGLSNLKSFRADRKLAQATYIFLVTYLTTREEKAELLNQFKALDKNNDGTLTREELIEGYRKFHRTENPEEFVDKLMSRVDTNKSGTIDYTEFIMAAMDQERLASQDKLEEAFKAFDQDGNGFITVEELKQMLGSSNVDKGDGFWSNLIKEVDQNGDGQISLKEFKDMMVKGAMNATRGG